MTFTYPQLLKALLREGKTRCSRGLSTKELIDIKLVIDGNNLFFVDHYARNLEHVMRYFVGELIWYLSGDRTTRYISQYSKFWNNLRNNNGTINSNYGHLIFYKKNRYGFTSFEWAKKSLLSDKDSRQALLLYNDRDSYYDENKDFTCTQTQHMLIRDNKLISIVYLRSSDVILGLTYDIPWWSFVQQQMLHAIRSSYPEVQLGKLIINIGSAHLYAEKINLVEKMLWEKVISKRLSFGMIPVGRSQEWYASHILDTIDIYPFEIGIKNKIRSNIIMPASIEGCGYIIKDFLEYVLRYKKHLPGTAI